MTTARRGTHAFLPLPENCSGYAVGMSGGAADAVIGEAFRRHDLGIVQIASVNDDGIPQFLAKAVEIEVGELLPFREDEQGIGAMRGLVGGVGEL